VRRYEYGTDRMWMAGDDNGPWVRYHDANNAIQDERDKLARIERVAQVAMDNWPHDTFLPAVQTILQICKDGKASSITERSESE